MDDDVERCCVLYLHPGNMSDGSVRRHVRRPPPMGMRNRFVQLLEMAFLRNTPVGPLFYLLALENGVIGERTL